MAKNSRCDVQICNAERICTANCHVFVHPKTRPTGYSENHLQACHSSMYVHYSLLSLSFMTACAMAEVAMSAN